MGDQTPALLAGAVTRPPWLGKETLRFVVASSPVSPRPDAQDGWEMICAYWRSAQNSTFGGGGPPYPGHGT